MNDTVSVVIPTRGRPDLVTRAVASALAQTHPDLEVIVVVDGPDVAAEAALGAIRDQRLRVIVNASPLGGGGARNVGIDAASSPWIAFLDDDDEWLPAKVERQLAAARTRSDGSAEPIVFCPIIIRTASGDVAWRDRAPRPGEPISEYLFVRRSLRVGEGTIGTSTILTTRALLERVPFDAALPRYQDADWILRACAAGAEVVYCPERLSVWSAPGPGGSITATHRGDWRAAHDWIRERRHLVTGRAYAAFLLVRVASLAAVAGDRSAIQVLWREARRRGRPGLFEVVLFAGRWVIPTGFRTRIRHRVTGTSASVGRS